MICNDVNQDLLHLSEWLHLNLILFSEQKEVYDMDENSMYEIKGKCLSQAWEPWLRKEICSRCFKYLFYCLWLMLLIYYLICFQINGFCLFACLLFWLILQYSTWLWSYCLISIDFFLSQYRKYELNTIRYLGEKNPEGSKGEFLCFFSNQLCQSSNKVNRRDADKDAE